MDITPSRREVLIGALLPLLQAASSAATARGSEARPAAPTAAYWLRKSSCAFADHGSNSQSRQAQVVLKAPQNSAAVSAARTRSRNWRARIRSFA